MSSPLKYLAASAILFISTAALTSEPTIPEFPREFLTNVGPSEWNGRTEPDDVSLVLKPARKHWGFEPEKESQSSAGETLSEPKLEGVTKSQGKEKAAAVDGRNYTVITPIYIGAAGSGSRSPRVSVRSWPRSIVSSAHRKRIDCSSVCTSVALEFLREYTAGIGWSPSSAVPFI